LKIGKHVIFLGAGASNGSGYPLANELRLLISSEKKWEKALVEYENKHRLIQNPIKHNGVGFWNSHREVLDLFRNGGFATIDEFCKLVGGFQFESEIYGLRYLVRAALGLFNPEENFEKSEYYGFIQSLFKDDLMNLREDITVLTYNYDPYLEFLLHRALEKRWQISRKGKSFVMNPEDIRQDIEHGNRLNAVTSGFYSADNLTWLDGRNREPSFSVLKLHGQICYPSDFKMLFSTDVIERATKLFQVSKQIPPMLFPWEIMTDKGFIEEKIFPFRNSNLYPLFRGIWERAKREVQSANKISFVGLSMHSFLFDGLKYLFEGKEGQVEVCVANPDNTPWVRGNLETYWQNKPHSSAYAVNKILKDAAPKMSQVGMFSGGLTSGHITLVNDFGSFVKTQMKPITLGH
jgi:hypothetical protein